MNVCETIKQLNSEKTDAFMHELYGKGAAENKARYEKVLKGFEQAFWRQQRSPSFSHHRAVQRSAETTQTTTTARCWPAVST